MGLRHKQGEEQAELWGSCSDLDKLSGMAADPLRQRLMARVQRLNALTCWLG
jgi:hypothetical protein